MGICMYAKDTMNVLRMPVNDKTADRCMYTCPQVDATHSPRYSTMFLLLLLLYLLRFVTSLTPYLVCIGCSSKPRTLYIPPTP
jgi:hypothetical protein